MVDTTGLSGVPSQLKNSLNFFHWHYNPLFSEGNLDFAQAGVKYYIVNGKCAPEYGLKCNLYVSLFCVDFEFAAKFAPISLRRSNCLTQTVNVVNQLTTIKLVTQPSFIT